MKCPGRVYTERRKSKQIIWWMSCTRHPNAKETTKNQKNKTKQPNKQKHRVGDLGSHTISFFFEKMKCSGDGWCDDWTTMGMCLIPLNFIFKNG